KQAQTLHRPLHRPHQTAPESFAQSANNRSPYSRIHRPPHRARFSPLTHTQPMKVISPLFDWLQERGAGVLLHPTALPGNTGIGTLGKGARDFIDLLHEAGIDYWQMCPLGPTGYGDSPYQSFSAFAGNPYLIDLGLLA